MNIQIINSIKTIIPGSNLSLGPYLTDHNKDSKHDIQLSGGRRMPHTYKKTRKGRPAVAKKTKLHIRYKNRLSKYKQQIKRLTTKRNIKYRIKK